MQNNRDSGCQRDANNSIHKDASAIIPALQDVPVVSSPFRLNLALGVSHV